jgi:hypothetical protein
VGNAGAGRVAGPVRAVVAVVVAVLVSGCGAEAEPERAAEPACGSEIRTGPLPEWARAGFSDDGSGFPHVLGRDGDLLGVLFGAPLRAPPAADRANKILWVSRTEVTPGDPLRIAARLDGGTETADREIAGGPGPSIVDLPRAGCWRLTLSWSGHTDTLDLTYTPPGPSRSAGPGGG